MKSRLYKWDFWCRVGALVGRFFGKIPEEPNPWLRKRRGR